MSDSGAHCWHPDSVGWTFSSYPPVSNHVCCRCNMKGRSQQETVPVPGHGPYATQRQESRITPASDGPCVPISPLAL
jgi:hypothetical protein